MYEKAYASGQNSTGFVAYEEFVFDTADEGIAAINDVIFGCNVQTVGELFSSTGFYGVFGLSPSIPSFIHNLNDSKKFSYYIGDIRDHTYAFNQLALGEGVNVAGIQHP